MKFSIITPVRNMEQYIGETIESVVNQKKLSRDDEIQYLIIDGLSTDRTIEIIKEYQKKFPYIQLISEKDESMYDALVKGLQRVNGEVVSYINAGDFYNLNTFANIKKIFSENKDIFWLTGNKYIYNENSEIIRSNTPYIYRNSLIQCGAYGRYLPYIQQESTFWKKELNELIDFKYLKNLKLSGDYYLWCQFSKNYELKIVQTHLGGFRIHENQLSLQRLNNKLTYKKEMKTFVKKINLKTALLILIDFIPWMLLRYSNTIFGRLSNHYIFNVNAQKYLNNKNDIVYCWACDLGENRGEGRLALKYIEKEFSSHSKFYFKNTNDSFYSEYDDIKNKFKTQKDVNLSFFESYISPIIGIFWLWYNFILGRKVCYLNFFPLWNSLLIIFLPPKTILGVITGSIYHKKVVSFKTFLRKYIVPIFYFINSKLILIRSSKLNFSTNLLKKYFSKNNKKLEFDFIFKNLELKKYEKKDIDFALYFRKYDTKSNEFFKNIIKFFNQSNYKFVYFGDKCENIDTNYLGFLSHKEVQNILSKTKYSIISEENFYSFYSIECISNHVNIFYNKQNYELEFLKNNKKITEITFEDFNTSIDKINKCLKNFKDQDFPYKSFDFYFN